MNIYSFEISYLDDGKKSYYSGTGFKSKKSAKVKAKRIMCIISSNNKVEINKYTLSNTVILSEQKINKFMKRLKTFFKYISNNKKEDTIESFTINLERKTETHNSRYYNIEND